MDEQITYYQNHARWLRDQANLCAVTKPVDRARLVELLARVQSLNREMELFIAANSETDSSSGVDSATH